MSDGRASLKRWKRRRPDDGLFRGASHVQVHGQVVSSDTEGVMALPVFAVIHVVKGSR